VGGGGNLRLHLSEYLTDPVLRKRLAHLDGQHLPTPPLVALDPELLKQKCLVF